MEQLNSILNSWTYYAPISSITAVFFVLDVLILIAFFSHDSSVKKIFVPGKPTAILAVYGAFISVLILFPLTALILRQFQTVFYPYVYLWLMVPVIPVTAATLTYAAFSLKSVMKKAMYISTMVLTLIMLLLCGSIGDSELKEDTDMQSDNIFTYNECLPFLQRIDEIARSSDLGSNFTVLAPKEITEYIHMYTGNVATIYGRDLWDTGLAPYSYNVYPDDYYDLYTWETYEENYGAFYYVDGGSAYYYNDIFSGGSDSGEAVSSGNIIENLNGGSAYMELARQYGANAVIFYYGSATDTDTLNYLTENPEFKTEIFYLNKNEGYIIIYL